MLLVSNGGRHFPAISRVLPKVFDLEHLPQPPLLWPGDTTLVSLGEIVMCDASTLSDWYREVYP
jgi:hypothetical protein